MNVSNAVEGLARNISGNKLAKLASELGVAPSVVQGYTPDQLSEKLAEQIGRLVDEVSVRLQRLGYPEHPAQDHVGVTVKRVYATVPYVSRWLKKPKERFEEIEGLRAIWRVVDIGDEEYCWVDPDARQIVIAAHNGRHGELYGRELHKDITIGRRRKILRGLRQFARALA